MPRNYKSTAVFIKPDPRFGSLLASKLINKLMLDGKKSTAQKIFYDALDIAAKKLTEVEEIDEIFTKAIENARPTVEVRSKRVGGANYQVPREVKRGRQQTLAIRWIVDNARKKKGKPMAQRLAEELVDAYNGTGASVHWKENIHKMAEANKAYAHYA
ncbi:MAG: 30S ribosomal protein S7 [Planctomycetota bacterium]|jgi:small subunit ribosomal protein S7|nr:30S ribosomal protein S7 [Planctomycetota bacterium]MDP6762204.1 30S ribosomal protein S7 [Planctomycetota bacterium]MDP6990092.1 30S ribosomal protein S7 [Planctomycetota bacterium]